MDSAIFYDLQKVGIRAILRNNKGNTIMATNLLENEVPNPETIETLAKLRGLQLCVLQGIPNIIVESDCLLVIKEHQQLEDSFSAFGNLTHDIKDLMSILPECKLQFTNSLGNEAIHCLARYAWNEDYIIMWDGEVSDFLTQAVWLDKHCL